MATGFVLVGVEPGREREVFERVLTVPEVVDAHLLFGEYDIIARIEADDYDLIGQVVVDRIRNVPGVQTTKTLAKIAL